MHIFDMKYECDVIACTRRFRLLIKNQCVLPTGTEQVIFNKMLSLPFPLFSKDLAQINYLLFLRMSSDLPKEPFSSIRCCSRAFSPDWSKTGTAAVMMAKTPAAQAIPMGASTAPYS